MKILCVGQSAYDITLPVKEYPIENKKYKIDKCYECGGGSSNNAAYLLGLWGSDVYLASSIGKDIYGKRIKDELTMQNVNIKYFEELDVPTTKSYIINNLASGTRTIITNKSPYMRFTNMHEIDIKPDVIFLDGNDYEMSLKVLENNPLAIKIIDAGSIKEGVTELCKLCDYVVCSNDFAKEFTGINFNLNNKDEIIVAYKKMQESFPGKIIITLEEYGSFTEINNEYIIIPSLKVETLDTTGAGDIYHGAFTYFIANKYDFKEAIRLSNIAGAISVTKIGSKNSMPTLDEVINYHE